ncbi:expressed unknown protein [Seminavis robusta]|uniref:Uncharacterized protein n=1 Tax=Seminavis robusta TaxID=568900 RepID=A0A9N8DRN8_9STRA|nr:expressed unknown protein [Seminavis robusta]|eukprot:Sro304_g112531.1  (131) ;mRNA; r:13200-13592
MLEGAYQTGAGTDSLKESGIVIGERNILMKRLKTQKQMLQPYAPCCAAWGCIICFLILSFCCGEKGLPDEPCGLFERFSISKHANSHSCIRYSEQPSKQRKRSEGFMEVIVVLWWCELHFGNCANDENGL